MDEESVERLIGELAETRRHFDVVAEDLRGEVRLVADGVAGVSTGQEQFRSEVKGEFTEVRSMVRLSYAELDRQLESLEQRDRLETRVDRLETPA